MNKIPLFPKGIVSFVIKVNAMFFIGLLFPIYVIASHLLNTSDELLYAVLAVSVCVCFSTAAMLGLEYFKHRQKRLRVRTETYNFLYENNFEIDKNFCFMGKYCGYWFRVKLIYREYDMGVRLFHIIEVFCAENMDPVRKEQLNADYFFGNLRFDEHYISCFVTRYDDPRIKECFDELVRILKNEKLSPMPFNEWDEKVGKPMLEAYIRKQKKQKSWIHDLAVDLGLKSSVD